MKILEYYLGKKTTRDDGIFKAPMLVFQLKIFTLEFLVSPGSRHVGEGDIVVFSQENSKYKYKYKHKTHLGAGTLVREI